jgi:hypothetical protein
MKLASNAETALVISLMSSIAAFAQQPCTTGVRIDGTVTDSTGAVIPSAQVRAADGEVTTTDAAGHYLLPCVPVGSDRITVQAEGFTSGAATAGKQAGGSAHIDLHLVVAQLQTSVQVNSETNSTDSGSTGDSMTMNAEEVRRLPDDPDDLMRQLQMLASAAGGDPTATVITVDGFQNGSALPPKSSIASIRVAPDLFSSEYQFPPFGGGQVQIFTKPGADSFHGALFFTDSDGTFNATDPFSVTATPAGKRRYGFELSGPLVRRKSGFAVALEKRDIDEFNVVNATTLDANYNEVPFQQTIPAPERLWVASARGDWQVASTDLATLSFSSNVNNLGNEGVGGLMLPDAGYDSLQSEYDLRFANVLTPSANLVYETRIGYSWKRTADTPLSTTPSLNVAGYFLGGGTTNQNLNAQEDDLEIDDDVLITRGKHELKLGAQSLGLFIRDYNPNTFNGAYVFGGGSAPVLDTNNNPTSQTTTINAIEQYRRALLNLPGGTPTTYQITSGTPLIPVTQWRLGLYAQDSVKLRRGLTMNAGLRYAFQTTPGSYLNFGPRLGFAWAIDRKETWTLHARAGIFNNSPTDQIYATEVYRLNGVRQQQQTVYAPDYTDPLSLTPGSIEVSTVKQFPPSLAQQSTSTVYVNVEHTFAHHWTARVNYFFGEDWNSVRTKNINAPMVPGSVGSAPDPIKALLAPRPLAPNENIFQYQNSGHLAGNVVSFNLEQHSLKRLGLYFRYGHLLFKSNVVDSGVNGDPNSPQSSYSDRGESARVEWQRDNHFTLDGNLTLPYKFEMDTQFDAGDGHPYNITTGTDNNGDGDFNDRPAYAAVPGPGVYNTHFGLLTTNTVNGDVPRNPGTMPGTIHLDMNLSRVLMLSEKDREHPRSFTFNVRSANLLNHTNVTAVNTVLSSPVVGQPIAAEAGRRVELGVRFAF